MYRCPPEQTRQHFSILPRCPETALPHLPPDHRGLNPGMVHLPLQISLEPLRLPLLVNHSYLLTTLGSITCGLSFKLALFYSERTLQRSLLIPRSSCSLARRSTCQNCILPSW